MPESTAPNSLSTSSRRTFPPRPALFAMLAILLFLLALGTAFGVVAVVVARAENAYVRQNREMNDTTLVAESKAAGDSIALALRQFRQERGKYPHALSELVPTHLPSITPPSAGGSQWRYHVHNTGTDFSLCFGAGEACYPSYCRGSANSEWAGDF